MSDQQSDGLAAACAMWQSGRDGGSSRLRGAARVLTGIPHYFTADFITGHEEAARVQPDAIRNADTLLRAVAASTAASPAEWKSTRGVAGAPFAGRGLKKKAVEDVQIAAALERGHLEMPLWGVSLDPDVARSFGTDNGDGPRWLLVLDGSMHAVAAWVHSGIKEYEYELITGGSYAVDAIDTDANGTDIVQLRELGPPDVSVLPAISG